jgi:predicted metal-dependent phosphotriesterase family hydrolase
MTIGRATTVLGDINAEELGHVQPHEHVAIDAGHLLDAPGYVFTFRDEPLMVAELGRYKGKGGTAVVDVTPADLGRDPNALVRISEASGVHIVMGCGWYMNHSYADLIDVSTTEGLAEILINEIEEGVAGTGVKPGIIGEVGTAEPWVKPAEERVFRAVARAHRKTGIPITLHTGEGAAKAQFGVLKEEKVDASRLIFGHCDNKLDIPYHEWILETGAYLEFDLIGIEWINSDQRRIEALGELVRRGHTERLLLSLDICYRSRLWTSGGPGYSFLLEHFLPQLRGSGVSEEAIFRMTHENPQRVLGYL